MPEQNQKPTKEDRMLRALEFLASDVQGVRIEFGWVEAGDRKTCRDMLSNAPLAYKVQVAVQLPRCCERLIGIPMPTPKPGLKVANGYLRIMAPADAFLKLRADTAPVNSLHIDFSDPDIPLQDNELRVMVGRGTFGCRIVT
jgi:hypothetical protein